MINRVQFGTVTLTIDPAYRDLLASEKAKVYGISLMENSNDTISMTSDGGRGESITAARTYTLLTDHFKIPSSAITVDVGENHFAKAKLENSGHTFPTK